MRRNKLTVILILGIWFVISFVTNILGPIMPAIIDNYHVSLTMAGFLPFSFFLAYGIMSIPAGILIERYGAKIAMLIAFGTSFAGALLFALYPVYEMALVSLFTIGIGMAMLQVIINPLMRVAGGEEHFAFYSVLAQLVFGAASFLSPYVFIWLTTALTDKTRNFLVDWLYHIVPQNLQWTALYWIFAFVFLLLLIIIAFIQMPRVDLTEAERSGPLQSYRYLLKKKHVVLYFFGIMAYVGTEQGLANWMSKFLSLYHGIDPLGQGAHTVALFWGLMSIGCLLGLVALKLMDSKKVLRIATVLAIISVLAALFGSTAVSLMAFAASGFFISVIFSIVFSLALNSEETHHGSFSGILCSGIFGGALVPVIIGWFGDLTSLRTAMLFIFIPLGYLLSISFWARPIINNKIISVKELFEKTPSQTE